MFNRVALLRENLFRRFRKSPMKLTQGLSNDSLSASCITGGKAGAAASCGIALNSVLMYVLSQSERTPA